MRTMNIGVLIILTCNLYANEFIETGCMFVSVAWLKSFCTCITFMRAGYMLLSVETVVPLLDNCFCLLWYYLSPWGNCFWQLDICFWETNLRWFLYFLCCVQRRKDPSWCPNYGYFLYQNPWEQPWLMSLAPTNGAIRCQGEQKYKPPWGKN